MTGKCQRRVLRHSIPVDDQLHTLRIDGQIVHVASRAADYVEFWTLSTVDENWHTPYGRNRDFLVVGTGHLIPDTRTEWKHVGTAIVPGGALVWHLLEAVI